MLLQTVADRLGDLHNAALNAGLVHLALSSLPVMCGSAAARATSDAEAVAEASRLWSAQLDEVIAAGGGDPDLALLQSVRASASTPVQDDHFARLFGAITRRAAAIYGDRWIEPRLDVGWLLLHPRASNDSYALQALTKAGPDPVVELAVQPAGFGPAAYAALPYVLVHEAICHVPSRPLGEVLNSSPFSEGFMDWTARSFLADWIADIDAALAPAALEHAARIDQVVTEAATPAGAARLRGRRAAERIVARLIAQHQRSRFEAQTAVARLACDLNCVDRGLAFKDGFVIAVNDDWTPEFEAALLAVIETRAPPESLLL